MNWNGQRNSLDHFIRRLSDPANADQYQAEFDARRRAKVLSSMVTRPLILNLQFNMSDAASTAPYRALTAVLPYDVAILGFKTDTPGRSVIVRRTDGDRSLVYVGNELNTYLTLNEFAGVTADVGGGQPGVYYWPSPILLRAKERFSIEMYKPDATPDPEQANIALVGIRVLASDYATALISALERTRLDQLISLRAVPEVRYLKIPVEFDVAGVGGQARNLSLPSVEEPLLLRGIRTTLRQSTISLNIEGEPTWTPNPVPVWAIAGEDSDVVENYQWFARPIYLRPNASLQIPLITNSIDGALIDAQTGNTITVIAETV